MVSKNNFSGSQFSSINNLIYRPDYLLIGLSSLVLSNSDLSFSASVDSDFVLSLQSSSNLQQFTLFYLVFGILPSQICPSSSITKYVLNNSCVSTCPNGTVTYSYPSGGQSCRSCSAKLNTIPNSNGTACICSTGYTSNNGICSG